MSRAATLGLSALLLSCTSLGELSDYAAGAAPSTAPQPLNPGGGGGSGTSPSDAGGSAGTGGTTTGDGAQPSVIDESEPPSEDSNASTDAALPPAAAPEPLARFVRLVADADVNLQPYTSCAELGILDEAGAPLDRTGWVATADSEEKEFAGGAPARLAIDGDPVSMWHTEWSNTAIRPPHPHFLQVDLGTPRAVGGFRYLPRQDGSLDGSITDYRFYVSDDGVEWGAPVAQGRFDATIDEHEVRFER